MQKSDHQRHVAAQYSGKRSPDFGGRDHSPVFLSVSETVTEFQVIGERCSGTNYVDTLIAQNTPLRRSTLAGWKHGFPTFLAIPRTMVLVVVVRNAISWVRSVYAKPWHTRPDRRRLEFSDFIRVPWQTIVDQANFFNLEDGDPRVEEVLQYDRHPITGEAFENVLRLRSVKLAAHLGLLNREINMVVCTHENVSSNAEIFLDRLGEAFNFSRLPGLRVPEARLGWAWPHREPLLNMPAPTLNEKDRLFLISQLDLPVEARLGYQYADTQERS